VSGATVLDGQGQGTIQNDDSPILNINDVTKAEGNSGTTTFTFTVSSTLPAPAGGITFDIATSDGTAQDHNPASEDNDYVAKSLTSQTIPAGQSTYTFDVTVNGDKIVEPDETFNVRFRMPPGAVRPSATEAVSAQFRMTTQRISSSANSTVAATTRARPSKTISSRSSIAGPRP